MNDTGYGHLMALAEAERDAEADPTPVNHALATLARLSHTLGDVIHDAHDDTTQDRLLAVQNDLDEAAGRLGAWCGHPGARERWEDTGDPENGPGPVVAVGVLCDACNAAEDPNPYPEREGMATGLLAALGRYVMDSAHEGTPTSLADFALYLDATTPGVEAARARVAAALDATLEGYEARAECCTGERA